jgi:hypothetical protein
MARDGWRAGPVGRSFAPMTTILLILSLTSLLISIVTAVRVFMILGAIRKESRRSFEVASQVHGDWEKFSARETEERQRLGERVERFENATSDRVEKCEKVATNTRERLIKLEQYLKEFFEVELKSVFDSFDKTVSSILEEMKAELLRGIDRIEDIQAFVDSKSFAQDRILDGEGSVYRLLADTGGDARAKPAVKEAQTPYTGEAPKADRGDKPPYRLEPDDAE